MRHLWLLLALVLGLAGTGAAGPASASVRPGSGAILFVSDRDSVGDVVQDDVYALVPATGRTYRLTRDLDVEWQPTLSPDGRVMAFIHIPVTDGAPSLDQAEVRACPLLRRHGRLSCGPERTLVPAGGVAPSTQLSWTGRGRSLLYGGIDPLTLGGDVYSVPAHGGEPVDLTQEAAGSPEVFDGQPDVAQDGRSFVYFSAGDLYRRDIDGSHPVQLTSGARVDAHPELSPDGRRITFQTTSPGDFDVWVMDARPEGADNRAVDLTAGRVDPAGAPTQERLPTWSPDGRRIGYMWHVEYDTANPFFSGFDEGEIYSMRPDGTDVRNETHDNGATEHPFGDILPSWGPLPKALSHVRR